MSARADAKRALVEKQLAVRLPITEIEQIRRIASNRGVSIKQLIRDALGLSVVNTADWPANDPRWKTHYPASSPPPRIGARLGHAMAEALAQEMVLRETLRQVRDWDVSNSLGNASNPDGVALFVLPQPLRKLIDSAIGDDL